MAQAHHIHPVSLYIKVWFVLMILLLATVLAVEVHLEEVLFPGANVTLAMLIALVKAMVVVLWFMHMKEASKLVWVFAGASFVWFGLMVLLTYQDYGSRGWVEGGWESPVRDSYTPAHVEVANSGARLNAATDMPQNVGPESGTMDQHK